MFNSMNCLILKVRGIHALKPFPSVPAALDQGHAWSKLKKFPPQVTNPTHDRTIQWELKQEGDRNRSLNKEGKLFQDDSSLSPS